MSENAHRSRELPDRFWAKVAVDADSGCWNWTGGRSTDGYGRFNVAGLTRNAHRVAYTALVGPVSGDLVIDHLCRNRACVNPSHLEAVTHVENVRRGGFSQATHCVNGHPFDETNTYRRPTGHRACRACFRAYSRAYRQRKKHPRLTVIDGGSGEAA